MQKRSVKRYLTFKFLIKTGEATGRLINTPIPVKKKEQR